MGWYEPTLLQVRLVLVGPDPPHRQPSALLRGGDMRMLLLGVGPLLRLPALSLRPSLYHPLQEVEKSRHCIVFVPYLWEHRSIDGHCSGSQLESRPDFC